MLPGGSTYTYTYDDYHNPLTATSATGIRSALTYAGNGNLLTMVTGESTPKIEVNAQYISDGNYISSMTDSLRKVTQYGYDTQKGQLNWIQQSGDTTQTRTNYTYDTLGRLTGLSRAISATGNSAALQYAYEEDLLKTITTNSTTYTNTYGDFGLKQSVKAGEHTLASYTYDVAGKSFLLTELSYGNGNSVAYEYDDLDRIIAVRYDGETDPSVEYLYDNMGSATLRKDNIAQVQTKQLYDFADRLCRIEEKGMGSNALDHAYEWTYDQRDNVASITETLNGASWEIAFAYNADDILTQATYGTNAFANAFDTLGRQTQRTHTVSGSTRMTTTYGYINPDSTHTTTLLSTVRNQGTQFDKTTAYTYDDHGNITSVTANGSTTTYVYDNLGQLTRENNQAAGKTWTWTYDTAGNILCKSEYAYTTGSLGTALDTVTYGYADSRGWGDLLTSYDGRSFQYDEIGNLLSDGEWTYTWSKGRQLVSMTKPGSSLTFTYDADGNRTSKTVNGVTTNYTYVDGRVTHETNGTDTIHYRYDTNGTLLSMNLNGTEYYYLYNGQRDVIGLYDASGNVVVEYTYDAWGRLLTTTGSLAGTVGTKNPYRYRSYRYDAETELFYLSTRFYSSILCRFISSDIIIGNRAINMFAYANNNPIVLFDQTGTTSEPLMSQYYEWSSLLFDIGSLTELALSLVAPFTPVAAMCVAIAFLCPASAPIVDASPAVSQTEVESFPIMEREMTNEFYPNTPTGIFLETYPDASIIITQDIIAKNGGRTKEDVDPYARPNQKKQGRELKNKARTKSNFTSRANKPTKPLPKHTPGRDHRVKRMVK